ncbi:MAG: hypothetical protein GY696_21240, partial [Gammaproteobacteria bacterium]|nr:hypothetical protein [Gammaproteobacteria bacterium]
MASDHPPDQFLPNSGEDPRIDFREWASDWSIYILRKTKAATKNKANRRVSLPAQLTPEQTASLNALDYVEEDKLVDLFSALGTEGYRRFRLKTGWQVNQLGQHTHDEALEICTELFQHRVRPIVARRSLIRRQQKKGETMEAYLCSLRAIAKDCNFADREDER